MVFDLAQILYNYHMYGWQFIKDIMRNL